MTATVQFYFMEIKVMESMRSHVSENGLFQNFFL